MALRIEDYALIGDCETAALVGNDGSIDWLCWPTFASSACMAALLGTEDNGFWRIAPTSKVVRVTRQYRPHTLILETTFETEDGALRLIDCMPPRGRNSDIVRIVEGIRGTVPVRMQLSLRFDYGRTVPWVTRAHNRPQKDPTAHAPRADGLAAHGATSDHIAGAPDASGTRAIAGPDMVVLRTTAPLRGEALTTVSEFDIAAGQRMPFVLTYGASHEPLPRAIDPEHALAETQKFWEDWTGHCRHAGPYSEAVERSLITLKALTYRPTGGIVAAATTSLPEELGGVRNWDYRYCWLRDATLTLLALMNGGYYEEAAAWQDWLLRAIAGSPDQVQIMYGIGGERQLLEWEVPWLDGYEQSKPVRIGNAASGQVQLDIYGEVLDAFSQARRGMKRRSEIRFRLQASLVDHLETIWQQPDEGIWETRGGSKDFTYSKMMAWVAFDRIITASEQLKAGTPPEETLARWRTIRDQIHAEICSKAFDAELGSFVQAYGSKQLDAALLLMPTVGFLPAEDERVRGTVGAIEKNLMRNGLVLRYDTGKVDDGLPPGEGVFLACSFWMVTALYLIGREEDARKLFDQLLLLRNDVGLLSEEYEVGKQRLVGNFPQAFSHIALVNAAFDLENGPHHRDGTGRDDSGSN